MSKKHAKSYDVNITIIRPSTSNNGYDIKAGTLTESQITQYLAELSAKGNVPEKSCIKRMFANMNTDITIYLSGAADKDHRSNRHNGKLNVFSFIKSDSLCSAKNCAKAIKTGKCTDKFVIETIGKKFFADKYKDKQTKQR